MDNVKRILAILLGILCLTAPALAITASAAEPTAPSGLPLSEIEYRVDEIVARTLYKVAPGVAVVVFREGEIIFSKGYGYANIGEEIPIDSANTVFEFGSVSKTSIWVAIMQLVERGVLDLDTDINYYLPEDFRQQIAFEMPFTLRDIMNHASGFGNHVFDVKLVADRPRELAPLEEALLLVRPTQIFEPGTIGAYSNFGVSLAALIVQYKTGQSFADYERENILNPAGMFNTFAQPHFMGNDEFLSNKATGHTLDSNGVFHESVWSHWALYPAGGLNGTAEDFARFGMSLVPPPGETGPFFQNPDTLATMFTPSSLDHAVRPGTTHGLWRWDRDIAAYGHVGLTISFSTYFAVVPEEQFGFVVHTNSSFTPSLPFIVDIAELLLGSNLEHVSPPGLPHAESVEGAFVLANRHDNFLLEFVDYISYTSVNAIDENNISLTMTFMGHPVRATYAQVEPYVFRLTEGTPFMRFLYSELRFEMEDGVPIRIIAGNGFDLTALPPGREMPILIGSLITALVSLAYFIITPIVLLVMFLIRRKKDKLNRFKIASTGFLLCGTIFVSNQFILLQVRLASVLWRRYAEVVPLIWINYVTLALSIIFFALSIITLIKEKHMVKKSRIFLFVLTAILQALVIIGMFNWHFFSLR